MAFFLYILVVLLLALWSFKCLFHLFWFWIVLNGRLTIKITSECVSVSLDKECLRFSEPTMINKLTTTILRSNSQSTIVQMGQWFSMPSILSHILFFVSDFHGAHTKHPNFSSECNTFQQIDWGIAQWLFNMYNVRQATITKSNETK